MRLAAQLYTLRDFTGTPQGLEDSLRLLHGIGYEGVQLSAVSCMNGPEPQVPAAWAKEMLVENGLECAATHRAVGRLQNNLDEEIQFHKTLGCSYVAIGGASGAYGERPEDYRRFIAEFTPIASRLQAEGIRFGYHNHDYEFAVVNETNQPCYEIILNEGHPHIMLEIDTYWVAHAGHDPVALLKRAAGRIQAIHLKDRKVVPGVGPVMTAVGEGEIDWHAVLQACREGGTEWLIVEQDICDRDPFDCLNSSYLYLSELLGTQ